MQVIGESNNKQGIDFELQLTPEQYEVYETLAKLQGQTVHEYIHDCLIYIIKGAANNIEDYEERKRAEQEFENDDSTVTMERTIIIRGSYRASSAQLAALPAIAKAMDYDGPRAVLEWAIKSGAYADLDHLGSFSARDKMQKALEES